VVRRALRSAHERGIIAAMPALPRHSPQYKPRETWLTEAEFDAVCAELEPGRRLWACLAALAGGSAGEVERCAWETTNLVDGVLLMPGTKRDTRRRWVPIAPALYAYLDDVKPKDRRGLLVERWGNVRRDLHAACDRAKVKRVSPNDLRRTFASWMVQQGVDLFTVSNLMGHSSTRMVEKVYGKLSREKLQAAIASVPAFQRVRVPHLSQIRAALPLLPPTGTPTEDEGDE
jgi:integrase